jgi:aspartyl/asparaginyl-tRNA synthetase
MYGSQGKNIELILIKEINESLNEKQIWVRGRVTNIRGKGNLAFLVIRDNMLSV